MTSSTTDRLTHRLLTGPDDSSFCERVSEAIADGYQLYGSASITSAESVVTCAQAVVLREENR